MANVTSCFWRPIHVLYNILSWGFHVIHISPHSQNTISNVFSLQSFKQFENDYKNNEEKISLAAFCWLNYFLVFSLWCVSNGSVEITFYCIFSQKTNRTIQCLTNMFLAKSFTCSVINTFFLTFHPIFL